MYKTGIDIGSTTAKIVITDENENVIFKQYNRHYAQITNVIIIMLKQAINELGDIKTHINFTGSAAMGVAERTKLPFVQEVIAASEFVQKKYPQTKTLIDIGGEDSKMIFFHNEKAPDIRMNGSCAGGTGAFIDQIATLLNVAPDNFNNLITPQSTIYPIASRCGVFAKTDVQNLISRNTPASDIAASVFHAVAIQTLNTLARGLEINPAVMFIGGPFRFLPNLKEQFIKDLNLNENEVITPENPEFFPAIGAAINTDKNDNYLFLSDIISRIELNTEPLVTNRLSPLFDSEIEYIKWKKSNIHIEIPVLYLKDYTNTKTFLGIDSGSTTTKLVLTGINNEILFQHYAMNNGNPVEAVRRGLTELYEKVKKEKPDLIIANALVTGYGEDLIRAAFSIHEGIVETVAHYTAAHYLCKDVTFIMDIGGQDMKAMFIKDGFINRIELNESCSSGCGSFIQTFGHNLGFEINEFAKEACKSNAPCDLGTRCTVFMNSKVKQSLRENASVSDISAGLAYSVIKNALYKVLKIKNLDELGDNIVVQGGTFRNASVLRALELLTGKKISCTNIPELMGAYGAALLAKNNFNTENKNVENDFLLNLNSTYRQEYIACKGCENICTVTKFVFETGNIFYSGNKCEKVFSPRGKQIEKGKNLFEFKLNQKFDLKEKNDIDYKITLGIPRVLNVFQNFDFWKVLFEGCGIRLKLSDKSTFGLYEKGAGSVMSDNICFPAKLVHGHIIDLVEQKVDRIFYPVVIKETNDFVNSENSYNCPIVSSYAEVIQSSVNTEKKYNIPFDYPVFSFENEELLEKSCIKYLSQFNINKKQIKESFENAIAKIKENKIELIKKSLEIISDSELNNRILVVLAGRPYHLDPLINHKTPEILTSLGVDVITEDAVNALLEIEGLQVISQWSYPNRILSAAQWVAKQSARVQFVQLNSFGCGPDAIIVDECIEILRAAGKPHTIIRIDEITSTGSVRLRLRSLIETLKLQEFKNLTQNKSRITTKTFEETDNKRLILAPYFADLYSDLIPALFEAAGYNLINLPKPDKESVDYGLQFANNEICYPATVIVGDIVKAVKSGKYNPDEIAAGITQTGGQCRATTYLSLIKKALVAAGYPQIPVISVGVSGKTINSQPGFRINWLKMVPITLSAMLYCDSVSRMYYSSVIREKTKGEALKLREKYISVAHDYIARKDVNGLFHILRNAVTEFNTLDVVNTDFPKIGIVGEIYVKYNTFGHRFVSDWLIEQGIEVIFPPILEFFTQEYINIRENQKDNITKTDFGVNALIYIFEKYTNYYIHKTNNILKNYLRFEPFHTIKDVAEHAKDIAGFYNQFGEGWLIPAEIAQFASSGVNHVVSLQPFGCIANQIISKGIEKKIKEKFEKMNLLFLDFDDGTSDVNIHNRLHFMISSLKKQSLKK